MVPDNSKTHKSAKTVRDADKLYELRFLVIPGKTDTAAEIESLTEFALALGPDIRIRLNAFQHHGVRAEAQDWETMAKTGIDKIAAHLGKAGISEVITPVLYL